MGNKLDEFYEFFSFLVGESFLFVVGEWGFRELCIFFKMSRIVIYGG